MSEQRELLIKRLKLTDDAGSKARSDENGKTLKRRYAEERIRRDEKKREEIGGGYDSFVID